MRRTLVVISLLALTGSAFAQPREREPAGESVTRYDENAFDRENVTGTRRSPLGDLVRGHGRGRFPSLLHVRTNFWPELTKSVENQ